MKMEDFFWRQHLSDLALPYGIKGSGMLTLHFTLIPGLCSAITFELLHFSLFIPELLLLKVLAVTANYHVPANIEK